MKMFLMGAFGIVALASLGALGTWQIVGPPDRSITCSEDLLEDGQICLSEVQGWDNQSYLWVDARPRNIWENNGIEGSILLTDDDAEDFLALEEAFMQAVYREGDPFLRVLIYCNEEGCGSSKAIAALLKEKFAEMMGFDVYVLYGGWKALADAGLVN
ncbi:MAG: rhodanese-like domain-containing protein [Akkermansiaceae bacterium]|jgi:rhodanese-related sulfurtransferase|nr:rhodanese-like domain-containing protein [Akkermansiaceae bacterium]